MVDSSPRGWSNSLWLLVIRPYIFRAPWYIIHFVDEEAGSEEISDLYTVMQPSAILWKIHEYCFIYLAKVHKVSFMSCTVPGRGETKMHEPFALNLGKH